MSTIDHRKEYRLLAARAEAYSRMVSRILDTAIAEITAAAIAEGFTGQEWFSFDDFPQTKRLHQKLQRQMVRDMKAVVVNGVTAVWEDSNFKNDRLVNQILGKRAKLAAYRGYFDNNEAALNSFISRQRNGLNLSKRIWKMAGEYETNLVAALSSGISVGKSADQLSREIRNFLHEPKKMFRRIKEFDADGKFRKWKLSKSAEEYNPGAGQYRSSYKNALRLTRTEINMAYRKADQTRWEEMDFVVGYEVKRSMSGRFDCPMCDALAGKYPKNFVFLGWHTQCMCYIVPILKTVKELDRDYERIRSGEDPLPDSRNLVADVPTAFKKYVEKQMPTYNRWKNKPYFVRDNTAYMPS